MVPALNQRHSAPVARPRRMVRHLGGGIRPISSLGFSRLILQPFCVEPVSDPDSRLVSSTQTCGSIMPVAVRVGGIAFRLVVCV